MEKLEMKKGLLKMLKKMMMDDMYSDSDLPKKKMAVQVESDSPEGLEEGLEKAKSLAEQIKERRMAEEDSEEEESEEECEPMLDKEKLKKRLLKK